MLASSDRRRHARCLAAEIPLGQIGGSSVLQRSWRCVVIDLIVSFRMGENPL